MFEAGRTARTLVGLAMALAAPSTWSGPITTTSDALALANAILVPNSGLTLIDATFSGPAGSAGTQSTGTGGIGGGAILTSGLASAAAGPQANTANTDHAAAGYGPLEAAMGGGSSVDAAVLTLTLQAGSTTNEARFNFAFGTDDSGLGIGGVLDTSLNDSFAAILNRSLFSGNIGLDTNGNPQRIQSTTFILGSDATTAYDRITRAQSSVFSLTPGEIFTLTFAVADFGDGLFDTGVYVSDLMGPVAPPPAPPPPPPPSFEGTPLRILFSSAQDTFVSDDTVIVNETTKEVVPGNPATRLGDEFLLPGEYVDFFDGCCGLTSLMLDMSIFKGAGKFRFSGWDPGLKLLQITNDQRDNLAFLPIDFGSDFFEVDWGQAVGSDPAIPGHIRFILVFDAAAQAPEPTSLALLTLGLAGLGWARRKTRRNIGV